MKVMELLNILRDNSGFDKMIKLGEKLTKINLLPIIKLMKVISRIEKFKVLKSSLVSTLSGNTDIKKLLNDKGILGVLDSIRKDSNQFNLNSQKDIESGYKHKLVKELKF